MSWSWCSAEELQDRLAAKEGRGPQQHWMLSQAEALTSDMTDVHWLLIEQDQLGIPVPLLLVVVFWLCLLFMSFGLFAPPNVTVRVVLFLCALARCGGDTNDPGPEQAFRGGYQSL